MNWQNVKLTFANVAGFLVTHRIVWIIAGLAVLLVVIAWGVDSCRQARTERKIDRIGENIAEEKVKSAILTNQKEAAEIEVRKNETNTNNARRDLDNSVRRDSNIFPTAENERRFCEQFPNDSTCQHYCATHRCP